jgi:hypothetical protein
VTHLLRVLDAGVEYSVTVSTPLTAYNTDAEFQCRGEISGPHGGDCEGDCLV